MGRAGTSAPAGGAPAGPVVLVDHLVYRGACSQQSGGDAFTGYVADAYAGYVADDVMARRARLRAEIQHAMLVKQHDMLQATRMKVRARVQSYAIDARSLARQRARARIS